MGVAKTGVSFLGVLMGILLSEKRVLEGTPTFVNLHAYLAKQGSIAHPAAPMTQSMLCHS